MYEFEDENISIEYTITNETFSHALGTKKLTGYDIKNIKAFIPALNDWFDVTHMAVFIEHAIKIVDKEIEGKNDT